MLRKSFTDQPKQHRSKKETPGQPRRNQQEMKGRSDRGRATGIRQGQPRPGVGDNLVDLPFGPTKPRSGPASRNPAAKPAARPCLLLREGVGAGVGAGRAAARAERESRGGPRLGARAGLGSNSATRCRVNAASPKARGPSLRCIRPNRWGVSLQAMPAKSA